MDCNMKTVNFQVIVVAYVFHFFYFQSKYLVTLLFIFACLLYLRLVVIISCEYGICWPYINAKQSLVLVCSIILLICHWFFIEYYTMCTIDVMSKQKLYPPTRFPCYYYDQYFNSLLGNRRFSNWPSWSSYYHRLCCCRCRCCYGGFGLYCNRSCNHCTACLHIYFFLPSSSWSLSSSNLRRFGFHRLKNSKGLPSLEPSNLVSPCMIRSRANSDNLPLHFFESMLMSMLWLLCC